MIMKLDRAKIGLVACVALIYAIWIASLLA